MLTLSSAMPHQSDKMKASVTRFTPEVEAKKTEEKKEDKENLDPPSALSD